MRSNLSCWWREMNVFLHFIQKHAPWLLQLPCVSTLTAASSPIIIKVIIALIKNNNNHNDRLSISLGITITVIFELNITIILAMWCRQDVEDVVDVVGCGWRWGRRGWGLPHSLISWMAFIVLSSARSVKGGPFGSRSLTASRPVV